MNSLTKNGLGGNRMLLLVSTGSGAKTAIRFMLRLSFPLQRRGLVPLRMFACVDLNGRKVVRYFEPFGDGGAAPRATSSASMNGPSLGGLASRLTETPNFFSASEATGPIDATSVRLRRLRNGIVRPNLSARAKRL